MTVHVRMVATAAIAAALLISAGPGQAGHAPAVAHVLVIESVELDITLAADLGRLVIDYELGPEEPLTGTPYCEESQVHVDAAGGIFTFDDNATADGCAEVRLPVEVPPGAQRLAVGFLANRLIGQTAGDGGGQSVLLQQFRILDEGGGTALSRDVFPANASARPELVPFNVSEPLGGQSNVTLSWLFDDRGFQGERLTTLQDFDATVAGIVLRWPAVRLPPPVVMQGEENAANATVASVVFEARVEVPAQPAPNGTQNLTLRTRHGPMLVGIVGPAGPLEPGEALVTDDGKEMRAHLATATLARHGPGDYNFIFVSSRALAPVPAPDPPASVVPFFAFMLLLPLPAAAIALGTAVGSRRQAEGAYRRIFVGILAVLAIALLYYAALAAYAIFAAGTQRMATLPLGAAARLVYAQLAFLLLFFAVTAFLTGRYLVRGMRRDIETRRRQEQALRRSNEELERFAYVASHDLQEPLRKVAGFTALLQRRYKGRLDKDADEMIDYAVDGATRMQALIRDILAFSRINSAQLEVQPVDAGNVMELIVSDLDGLIQRSNATVTWKRLPTVQADPGQLRQVLQNLVENGIKYRHPSRKPRVDVSATGDGKQWTFRVADNGVGIPKGKAEEIFGIFRRLHGREVPGTGIGLAIVKKALERHGGTIRVEQRRGGGSVFIFTLPNG